MPLEVHSLGIEEVKYVCISSCIYYAPRDRQFRDGTCIYCISRLRILYISRLLISRCIQDIRISRCMRSICFLRSRDVYIICMHLEVHVLYMYLDLKKHVLYYLKTMHLELHIVCIHSICIWYSMHLESRDIYFQDTTFVSRDTEDIHLENEYYLCIPRCVFQRSNDCISRCIVHVY